MDQPLFPAGATPPADPVSEPKATADPEPAATPEPNAEVQALQAQVQGIAHSVESLIEAMPKAVPAPAPEPTPEPTDPNDYLSKLANDPEATIGAKAEEIARKVAQDSYGGVATQLVETQHLSLMNQQQQRIDTEFGDGTFKEVYKPAMERDLKLIRQQNAMALANPESIQILVDRVTGQNRAALNERETKAKAKQQEDWVATRTEIAASLPPSGPRRGAPGGATLGDDEKLFLAEVQSKTGEKMDPDRFLKLMQAGNKLDDWQRVQKEAS